MAEITQPARQIVAWCAACQVYEDASHIGQRCPMDDCGHKLRKRVGYICRFCEQDGGDQSLWLVLDRFIEHLVEHVTDAQRALDDGAKYDAVLEAQAKSIEKESQQLRERLAQAEACTTCDGIPPASALACICGGTGKRIDETANLRAALQQAEAVLREIIHRDIACLCSSVAAAIAHTRKQAEARNRKLVEALRGLAHAGQEPCWCGVAIGNPMYRQHSQACVDARAALAEEPKT